MINYQAQNSSGQHLSTRLPWAFFERPGVILQKDGVVQSTLKLRGPDLQSSVPLELVHLSAHLNSAVKRFGNDWAIFVEAQRWEIADYPDSEFPDPATAWFDRKRRDIFQAQGEQFETHYFLTFTMKLPSNVEKATGFFVEKVDQHIEQESELDLKAINEFENTVRNFIAVLDPFFVEIRPLSDDETLSYLRSTIASKQQWVKTPEIPMYIDAIIGRESIETGFELRVGDNFIIPITISGFPRFSEPGMLDLLNKMPFPYRWMTRFILYDKKTSLKEVDKLYKYWSKKVKSLGGFIAGTLSPDLETRDNPVVAGTLAEINALTEVIEEEYTNIGELTTTIIVWGETKEIATKRANRIVSTMERLMFVAKKEDFNSFAAWLSSHPGNLIANVNRYKLTTLNFTRLIPTTAIWAGQDNSHLKAPALLYAQTYDHTPFKLSLNVGDVGHTLILGPTGAGKSTLLSTLMLQWFRYKNARVITFDKGKSSKAPCLCSGGVFFPISLSGDAVSFQPFGRVDEPSEMSFALDWIIEILEVANVEINPQRKKEIWIALQSLAECTPHERTVEMFCALIQDQSTRDVLEDYTNMGPYGGLFDRDKEEMDDARWIVFEMEEIAENPKVMPHVLSYLFHRLEERFNGNPTLLVLDEAWLFLDSDIFKAKIREWLKVLRKKNVYVIFASQSVSDVLENSIANVIIESCLTRILLPNSRAEEPSVRDYYVRLGLNDQEISNLAFATPKRDYYYISSLGSRLFQLGLDDAQLCFVATSAPKYQKIMDELESKPSDKPFYERFLEKLDKNEYIHEIQSIQ